MTKVSGSLKQRHFALSSYLTRAHRNVKSIKGNRAGNENVCVCVLHIHTYIRDVGRRLRALPNVTNVCNVNVGCRGETVKNSRYHATNAATADPRMLIRWSSPLLIPFSICIAAARIPKQHSSFFSYYYCKFTRVDNTSGLHCNCVISTERGLSHSLNWFVSAADIRVRWAKQLQYRNAVMSPFNECPYVS